MVQFGCQILASPTISNGSWLRGPSFQKCTRWNKVQICTAVCSSFGLTWAINWDYRRTNSFKSSFEVRRSQRKIPKKWLSSKLCRRRIHMIIMAWQYNISIHSYRKRLHCYLSLDLVLSFGVNLYYIRLNLSMLLKRTLMVARHHSECYLARFQTLANSECSVFCKNPFF